MLWDHDLDAVVFATPTVVAGNAGPLGPGVSADDAVAYVGTHAGRFVGVIVDGPRAGQIVVDQYVPGIIWRRAAWDDKGRLYFGADNDHLYALELATGELAWTKRLGNCKPPRAPGPEGVRCDVDGGPTLGPDGDLYVGADGLYRIAPDGEIRWRTPSFEDDPYAPHVYTIPLVTEDGLVIYGGYDGHVRAVSAQDGTERWQVAIGADVDGSPVAGPDGTIYIGADDGKLYALGPDGSTRWSFATERDIRGAVGTSSDGTIYVPSFDGNLYSVDATGAARWVLPTAGEIMSTPLVDQAGNIYVGSRDERLYGIAAAGRVLFNVEFPADIDSGVAISPRGTLVVGCDDGHLRALR